MSLDLEVLRKEALAECAAQFERIDTICLHNTAKVLAAYKEAQISSYQFAGTSGYGYSDMGREKSLPASLKRKKPLSVLISYRGPMRWRRSCWPCCRQATS